MDYEKAYKEALSRASKYYNANTNKGYREIFEDIFHEFKESEDERIRKAIICGMNALKEQHKETFASIPINDCIAWLEKQGGKVDVLDDFPTEFERQISHLIASFINNEWEYKKDFVKHTANALLQYAKNELKKRGGDELEKYINDERNKKDFYCEGKEMSWNEMPLDVRKHDYPYYFKGDLDCYPFNVEKQGKQKLIEWSEEDEEMYKEVLTDIIYAKNDLKTKGCLGLSNRAMKAFNWFSKRYKSLRPQSKWKPSKEQMKGM